MKKIITVAIIIIVVIALIFFKSNYKKLKFGNNMSNKTANEIAEYILDINSYEAKEEVTINSNKNTNKYVVVEKYIKEDNLFSKEIIEPENIKGMLFTYDGENLKIENSRFSFQKIYEKYPYVCEEQNSLIGFIKAFKEAEETRVEELNDEIILNVKLKNGNKYVAYEKLYISKNTGNPIKLEIQNLSQKNTIYILYNEIKIDNLRKKEDIFAISIEQETNDV